MASITVRIGKHGRKRYRVRIRAQGETAFKTFSSLKAAQSFARKTEGDIETGEYTQPTDKTLSDAITRYRRDVLPEKAESTRTHQDRQLTWWDAQLGTLPLDRITPALIGEYRDRLTAAPADPKKVNGTTTERGASGPTANRYTAALSHVLTMAVQWGWVKDNAAGRIAKRRESAGRVRYLDRDELTSLLKACRESRNPDLSLVVMMALATGMRRGEILGLRWADVDLDRGLVRVMQAKNHERRAVPIMGTVLHELEQRKDRRGLVFHAPGEPEHPIDPRGAFESACERAGIQDFRFHDLRHTAASYLAMSGATLAEVAEILGHKTLQMVKRYSHLSADHVSGVVERMNQRWLS